MSELDTRWEPEPELAPRPEPTPIDYASMRKGPDGILRAARALGMVAFPLMLTMAYAFMMARPEFTTYVDRGYRQAHGLGWQADWDPMWRVMLIRQLLVGGVMCAVGLAFSSMRHKREEDRHPMGLVLLAVAVVVFSAAALF